MNKEELKNLVATKIANQGNQVDLGGALASVLNELIDGAPETIIVPMPNDLPWNENNEYFAPDTNEVNRIWNIIFGHNLPASGIDIANDISNLGNKMVFAPVAKGENRIMTGLLFVAKIDLVNDFGIVQFIGSQGEAIHLYEW